MTLDVDDPDATVGIWVHWVLFDLPVCTISLPEGVSDSGTNGLNSCRRLGYSGPCPPPLAPTATSFKLYALDSDLNIKGGAFKGDVENAMQGHILAQRQLMSKYGC